MAGMNITAEPRTERRADAAESVRYLRQIRNMIAWVLIIWAVTIAAAVGVGIYLGHTASQASSSGSTANCPGTAISIQMTGC
jgi:flagellar basal body-associated protein FliL